MNCKRVRLRAVSLLLCSVLLGKERERLPVVFTHVVTGNMLTLAHTRGPASSRLKSLHKGTGLRDLSHEQFTRSVLRNKSQGLIPIIPCSWFELVGLVAGTKVWSLRRDFEAKMVSSRCGTCPRYFNCGRN